jgi:glycosyltransferase involved in cell wall biosynthesis
VKVLIVTPMPLETIGGTQRVARAVANALAADHGFEVVIASGDGLSSPPTGPVAALPREIRLHLTLPVKRQWFWPGARRLAHARLDCLEDVVARERPDVIVYTPHWSGCAEQAARAAEARNIPFVLWSAANVDSRSHTHPRARRLYRSAALLIAISEVERDWLIRVAGARRERVVLLQYGCSAGAVPRARPAAAGAIRLLTVGAYTRNKQIDHQIETVWLLREGFAVDARLTVASYRDSLPVYERLKRHVRDRALERAVELRMDCSDDEIAHLHSGADGFLFTSRSESFGVALLEAIAYGTFPVVYPHPVYRTLVESSGFGLIADASTPAALAHAVVRALHAPPAEWDDDARLRWLAARSWQQAVAPLALRLRSLQ